jgi:hypothetical protein
MEVQGALTAAAIARNDEIHKGCEFHLAHILPQVVILFA